MTASATATATYTLKVATPTFSPAAGTYSSARNVTIQCATGDAIIRFTIDGSVPTSASTEYKTPIFLNFTTTVRARAFKSGWNDSDLASATYTIKLPSVATPTFSPLSGTYSLPQTIIISCITPGAVTTYTLDGSEPTASSLLYSSPIFMNTTITVKAKSFRADMRDSATASATYTINLPKVAKPTFSPAGGTYSSTQNVAIQCATADAVIRYTTVGSVPLTVYSDPFMVSVTTTIIAQASKDGLADSDIASATFMINIPPKVAAPLFSPSGGSYSSSQNVALSCSTSGASITYTTDGSEPGSSSTVYAGPISISSTTTVKAKAFMRGMIDSDTVPATYTIIVEPQPAKVTAPVFSPAGGTYSLPQNVALSCATSGATIRYSVDGSDPSSSSTVYSIPIVVSATTMVKAKAFADGMIDSDTSSVVYIISVGEKVATPTFTPAGGSHSGAQSVVIQCATPGAVIRYTTSGVDPASSSPVYFGPIWVSDTTTIRAKAFMAGMTDSDIASVTYTISLATTSSQEPLFEDAMYYAAITPLAIAAVVGVALFYLNRRK
jgi:hypothetical protein